VQTVLLHKIEVKPLESHGTL